MIIIFIHFLIHYQNGDSTCSKCNKYLISTAALTLVYPHLVLEVDSRGIDTNKDTSSRFLALDINNNSFALGRNLLAVSLDGDRGTGLGNSSDAAGGDSLALGDSEGEGPVGTNGLATLSTNVEESGESGGISSSSTNREADNSVLALGGGNGVVVAGSEERSSSTSRADLSVSRSIVAVNRAAGAIHLTDQTRWARLQDPSTVGALSVLSTSASI
jgi:hypothetical protein